MHGRRRGGWALVFRAPAHKRLAPRTVRVASSPERQHRDEFRKRRAQHYKLDGAVFRGAVLPDDDDDEDEDEKEGEEGSSSRSKKPASKPPSRPGRR